MSTLCQTSGTPAKPKSISINPLITAPEKEFRCIFYQHHESNILTYNFSLPPHFSHSSISHFSMFLIYRHFPFEKSEHEEQKKEAKLKATSSRLRNNQQIDSFLTVICVFLIRTTSNLWHNSTAFLTKNVNK